MNADSNLISKL